MKKVIIALAVSSAVLTSTAGAAGLDIKIDAFRIGSLNTDILVDDTMASSDFSSNTSQILVQKDFDGKLVTDPGFKIKAELETRGNTLTNLGDGTITVRDLAVINAGINSSIKGTENGSDTSSSPLKVKTDLVSVGAVETNADAELTARKAAFNNLGINASTDVEITGTGESKFVDLASRNGKNVQNLHLEGSNIDRTLSGFNLAINLNHSLTQTGGGTFTSKMSTITDQNGNANQRLWGKGSTVGGDITLINGLQNTQTSVENTGNGPLTTNIEHMLSTDGIQNGRQVVRLQDSKLNSLTMRNATLVDTVSLKTPRGSFNDETSMNATGDLDMLVNVRRSTGTDPANSKFKLASSQFSILSNREVEATRLTSFSEELKLTSRGDSNLVAKIEGIDAKSASFTNVGIASIGKLGGL